MAGIDLTQFERIDKERNKVHPEVMGTYTVFETDGKKYFQIDTFGRIDRKIPGKTSQTLQFNRKTAEYLIKLLKQEFNLE